MVYHGAGSHAALLGGGPCSSPAQTKQIAFCSKFASICGQTHLSNGGGEYTNCEADVAAMDVGKSTDKEGDTFGCRSYHLDVAETTASTGGATTHCPHASKFGGGMCASAAAQSQFKASKPQN